VTDIEQPIFIVALPKSYTSVFSGMLGQHPGIMSVPELNVFVGDTVLDWATQPMAAIFCDGLIRTVAQLIFGAQTFQTAQSALAWLEARADWTVKQLFDALREAAAPAALLDQSPIYMQKPAFLRRILNNYPKARFIHLARNPVTWANSMEKWGVIGEQFMKMFAQSEVGLNRDLEHLELWHAAYSGIEHLFAELEPHQYTRVYGEDVVTRPREMLGEVLDWLNLPNDAMVVEEMMHPENSVFAQWGPPNARGGNNPDFLSAPQLRTRNDREKLMKMDLTKGPIDPEVLDYATRIGYVAA